MLVKAKTVCEEKMCTGCMACTNACTKNAINVKDYIEFYNAEIDTQRCINCDKCKKVCPNISVRTLNQPIYWTQGVAADSIRLYSSSGGAATALMNTFISSGGYVASCLFLEGEYKFKITKNIEDVRAFAGSKYVKSNPGNIYMDIKELLKKNEKVLFIGLPCQSAAVQNVCDNMNNLYTADLICHGTPSPMLLKRYLSEKKYDWKYINDIKFRENQLFGLVIDGKRIMPRKAIDSYTRLFLQSVDYTENCYYCRYATQNRVSDITLGDAWGQMSEKEPMGASLILCQSAKGVELMKNATMKLEEVDLEKAIETNHQLSHPSIKHPQRERFFKMIKNGRSIQRATANVFPKECFKQKIKVFLIKIHIIKDY